MLQKKKKATHQAKADHLKKNSTINEPRENQT